MAAGCYLGFRFLLKLNVSASLDWRFVVPRQTWHSWPKAFRNYGFPSEIWDGGRRPSWIFVVNMKHFCLFWMATSGSSPKLMFLAWTVNKFWFLIRNQDGGRRPSFNLIFVKFEHFARFLLRISRFLPNLTFVARTVQKIKFLKEIENGGQRLSWISDFSTLIISACLG